MPEKTKAMIEENMKVAPYTFSPRLEIRRASI